MCFLTNSFRKAAFTSAAITGLTLCTEYSSCHPSSSSGGAITRAALPDAPDAASGGRSSHIQTQNGGRDEMIGQDRVVLANLNSSSLSSFVIKLPGPLNTVLRGNGSASSLVRPVTADGHGDCGHGPVTVTAVRRRAWTMMVTGPPPGLQVTTGLDHDSEDSVATVEAAAFPSQALFITMIT